MKQRSPIAVAVFGFITLGIYSLYWQVVTKGELNQKGAAIPTAWLIIVPFVNIWWLWKYSEGVEVVTGNKISTIIAFILLWLLGPIGEAIIQDSFNKVVPASETPAAIASPVPDQSLTTPTVPPEVTAPPANPHS